MKKRYILIIMLLLVVCLVACDQETESKQEITFRITWKEYSGRGEAIKEIVSNFNATEKDFEIHVVSGDEDLDLIKKSLDEQSYDIYVLPYRYVKLLGSEKIISELDLNDYLDHETIYDALIDLGQVEDKQYGIPWVSHSMAIIFNKDLLDAAGIEADSINSREMFVEALAAVEANTDAHGIGLVGAAHNDLSWMVNQFIIGSGSQLIEAKKVALNNSNTYDALHYYSQVLSLYAQDNWEEHNGSDVMELFRNGEIAFEIQSLWGITDIWKNNNPFEVGTLPLSKIGANSEIGPMMLSYGIDNENEDVINRFISYMVSVDAQKQILQGEFSPEKNEFYPFRLPVRKDIIDQSLMAQYGVFQVFLDSYETPSIDVPSPEWMVIKDQLYTEKLHQLMLDNLSIEAFLNLVEKEGNEILGGTHE
jgi:multiple sugar transport system substrate-binding protein